MGPPFDCRRDQGRIQDFKYGLKSDLISKVISLEGDNFEAIYYLRGSEIWPDDKTGGL
jgi:hypothetical protein